MTITPYEGIAVFDVEENGYLFKEKGMYLEGMGLERIYEKAGIKSIVEKAIHTVKFLNAKELEEMESIIGEENVFTDNSGMQSIENYAIMLS
ncbi:hypothetical protein ACQR3P_29310 [Rhodococcus sp. IEGM1300]